jgi:hypothetical protein
MLYSISSDLLMDEMIEPEAAIGAWEISVDFDPTRIGEATIAMPSWTKLISLTLTALALAAPPAAKAAAFGVHPLGRCPLTHPERATCVDQVLVNDSGRPRHPHLTATKTASQALVRASLAALGPSARGLADAIPRISVHGPQLDAGSKRFRAFGMNWGVGDAEPVIDYFDNPNAQTFHVLAAQLQTAKQLGANSMRIYLQLGQVMATPTHPRARTLIALQELLALGQEDGIYFDVTGDLVWRPAQAPLWYAKMSEAARWRVQAAFWRAVARAAHSYSAVLCYELTSEPEVTNKLPYYLGTIGGWSFVQSIAITHGRKPRTLARAWTRMMAAAVRSQDDRPVTIGLLPFTTGAFAPQNVEDLLDMMVVHEYPQTGQAAQAIALINRFASFGKPLLLGETTMLNDDAATQRAFLTGVAPRLVGAFAFFDGRNPTTMQAPSKADSIYRQALGQFVALRRQLLASFL